MIVGVSVDTFQNKATEWEKNKMQIYKLKLRKAVDREHCSIVCNNLNGKRFWERIDTESFFCTPEPNITIDIQLCSDIK